MKISITGQSAREGQGGTHIRSTRRNAPALWLALVLVLMLFGMACRSISKPQGFAEPRLDGDTLYVTINPGKIAAVNTSGFTVGWEFPRDKNFACGDGPESSHDLRAIYGAPVIDGGSVYFGAYDGNVYAVNAANGACEWQSHKATDTAAQCRREPDGPIIGGMVLLDGTLWVGSDDGQLYALDAKTGVVQGCVDLGGAIWSAPLVVEKNLYVDTMEGAVWEVDPTNPGDPQSNRVFETEAALLTDPVQAGDKLLVGGLGQKLFAINIATGKKAWEFAGGNWFWGRPLVDGDTIYATNLDGRVYAINGDNGASSWQSNPLKADDAIRAGPILSGGTLVVVDRGGNVYSLDPRTGEVKKKSLAVIEKRVLANPIEVDGSVLVVAQNGNIYRIDPSGGEPPTRVQVVKQ